jgi:hypothetical protein
MDYNAGLVSQESFDRRIREIDEAVEKAAQVRERMYRFLKEMKKSAFEEMDRQFDLLRMRKIK